MDSARLVIIPSYNSGPLLRRTVEAVLRKWQPVWVVLDGTTDGSAADIADLAKSEPGLRVITLRENEGKGAATLAAMQAALVEGYIHALVMDADGQHPVDQIEEFMEIGRSQPEAMVLGVPVFGPEAPPERVNGRKIGNAFAHLETLWGGIEDSLFGFRLYPIAASVRIMESIQTARRFDFDTELVVRLFWAGVKPINRPAKVFYPPREEGAVTHFKYLRDNLLLIGTHTRLVFGMVARLPRIWSLQKRWRRSH